MNLIFWMGIEIKSSLPKELLIEMFNLAQKNKELYLKLAEWGQKKLSK